MHKQLYERYLELNMGFSPAFIYRVHPEGCYSQINMILIAAAIGLTQKKRLMVDTRNIIGNWKDYFGVGLPGGNIAMSWPTDLLPRRYDWLRYRRGTILLQWAETFHDQTSLIRIPDLDFEGNLFALFQLLATILCPHPKPKRHIFDGDYVACHVRRGDKLIREGQFHDVSTYLERIRDLSGSIKNIFVMTDDYQVIEDFRAQAPGYNIATMCNPHQRGYVNQNFLRQSRIEAQREIATLHQEVAIACASKIFVGCFLSNVSRFVALMHEHPERCVSVDVQTCWIPGVPKYQASGSSG